jgi:hypothetical protein
MRIAHFFTHCEDEKHLGVELLCDICNDALERPEIWYYRCVPEDDYPHMAVCTYCAAKMTVEMLRHE